MSADAIVVHSDLGERYNATRALVAGTVSYLVSIDINGKILAMKLLDSSGDGNNDTTAARIIRAVFLLKMEPRYEGTLKISFDGGAVS